MIKSFFSFQKFERGSALITSVIVAGSITAMVLAMPALRTYVEKQSVYSRAKAEAAILEGRVHALSLWPQFYNCTSINVPCTLNAGALQAYFMDPKGKVTGATLARINNEWHFQATMSYFDAAKNIRLKDRSLDFKVPDEIVSMSQVDCSSKPSTPIFKGFKADGSVNCVGITKPSCNLGNREFVKSIDAGTMNVNCESLATVSFGCSSTQTMVSKYQWDGGTSYSNPTCVPRLDPFQLYSFDPNKYWVQNPTNCINLPAACDGKDLVVKNNCGKEVSRQVGASVCVGCTALAGMTCSSDKMYMEQKDSCGTVLKRTPASLTSTQCVGNDLVQNNQCGNSYVITYSAPTCMTTPGPIPLTFRLQCLSDNNSNNLCAAEQLDAAILASRNIPIGKVSLVSATLVSWENRGCASCVKPRVTVEDGQVKLYVEQMYVTVDVTITAADGKMPPKTLIDVPLP
jgi:hypothetical protein